MRHYPGVEFVLAMVAVSTIALAQFNLHDDQRLLVTLSVPLCFLCGAKLFAGARLASAAARAYLMCFLGGLLGLGNSLRLAIGRLVLALGDERTTIGDSMPTLLDEVSGMWPHFLGPNATGIAVYIVCSVFEQAAESNHQTTSMLERFDQWLRTSDAPALVRQRLTETAEQVGGLQAGYGKFGEQLAAMQAQVAGAGRTAGDAQTAFAQLARTGGELSGDFSSLRNEIVKLRAELDQHRAAVREIGNVVDEFSRIAASNILKS